MTPSSLSARAPTSLSAEEEERAVQLAISNSLSAETHANVFAESLSAEEEERAVQLAISNSMPAETHAESLSGILEASVQQRREELLREAERESELLRYATIDSTCQHQARSRPGIGLGLKRYGACAPTPYSPVLRYRRKRKRSARLLCRSRLKR